MMAIVAGETEGRALTSARERDSVGGAWIRGLTERDLDRAYRLAGFILGDATEAEDAAQDALSRAWQSRGSLRDEDAAQAWFDRILVNLCRDRLRRRRHVRWLALDDSMPASTDPFARAIDADEMLRGLGALDADHRIAIVLRYWADLPLDSIADRLGVPLGTVKSRLHYALRDLRRAIEGPKER
jgi:RNA polymerase sigma-70 factor, ECF subfamily